MARPALEIADVFRDHGPAWRLANAGHIGLGQMKAMTAIERCRTAALGGHVARCDNNACGHTIVAYNSCLMCKLGNGESENKLRCDRTFLELPLPIRATSSKGACDRYRRLQQRRECLALLSPACPRHHRLCDRTIVLGGGRFMGSQRR